MLRTRLWMGAILIALTTAVLWLDQSLPPRYPFLLALILLLTLLACRELVDLLGSFVQPPAWLCYGGVTVLVLVNWLPHLLGLAGSAWPWIAGTFAALVLVAFLAEMARFTVPGQSVVRVALTVWVIAYLGVLPSFLAQLRWLFAGEEAQGTVGLALAIFVPKSCDIGAYFTGRLIGRHRMTPVLSPKKTWEGAVGGLVLALAASVGINAIHPVLPGAVWAALAGLALGFAGLLGDLAESLIKRDCQRKDASQVMPGFGGVLDIVDAILFSAPVAYGCLAMAC